MKKQMIFTMLMISANATVMALREAQPRVFDRGGNTEIINELDLRIFMALEVEGKDMIAFSKIPVIKHENDEAVLQFFLWQGKHFVNNKGVFSSNWKPSNQEEKEFSKKWELFNEHVNNNNCLICPNSEQIPNYKGPIIIMGTKDTKHCLFQKK
jgi:hypothetical protein